MMKKFNSRKQAMAFIFFASTGMLATATTEKYQVPGVFRAPSSVSLPGVVPKRGAPLVYPAQPLVSRNGITPESEKCVLFKSDPFDPGALMVIGPHKGECEETENKRPPAILADDAKEIVFANFRNERKYWIAHVPRNGVQEVDFEIIRFVGPLGIKSGHTELRFIMKPGSELMLENQTSGVSEYSTIGDFMVSTDYMAPHNVAYDSIAGMKPVFQATTRIVSTHDRVQDEILDENSPTIPYQLLLSDPERDQLLVNVIRKAQHDGLDGVYDTFNNNCTSMVFEQLDGTVNYPPAIRKEIGPVDVHLYEALDPIEGPSKAALKKRGLVDLGALQPESLNILTDDGKVNGDVNN
jgi:hypothetical protein